LRRCSGGHDALDILDPYPSGSRTRRVAERDLGRVEGHRLVVNLHWGDEAVQAPSRSRPLETTTGHIFEHRLGTLRPGLCSPAAR